LRDYEARTNRHVRIIEDQFDRFVAEFGGTDYSVDANVRSLLVYLNDLKREVEDHSYRVQDFMRRSSGAVQENEERVSRLFSHEVFKFVVEVATYLGTAAVGGIVGNRADAGLTAAAKDIFLARSQSS
jgi:hypothetical protein